MTPAELKRVRVLLKRIRTLECGIRAAHEPVQWRKENPQPSRRRYMFGYWDTVIARSERFLDAARVEMLSLWAQATPEDVSALLQSRSQVIREGTIKSLVQVPKSD